MAAFRSGFKILNELSKLQARSLIHSRSISEGPSTPNNQLLIKRITEPNQISSRFYAKKKDDKPDCPEKDKSKQQGNCPGRGIKLPGCGPRQVPDCTTVKKREKCCKLEAPYPSYSECAKELTPRPPITECPRTERRMQEHCYAENRGISIDGCNPPPKPDLVCPVRNCVPKKPKPRPAECVGEEVCDPCLVPYSKKASNTSSSAMKCPSNSVTGTIKMSEPMSVPKYFFTGMRLYSDFKKNKGKDDKPDCPKKDKAKQRGPCPGSGLKLPGCGPKQVEDCTTVKKREPCCKVEAPFPSFSECAKEGFPIPGISECPKTERMMQEHCYSENRGISIDGCNPPPKPDIVCPVKSCVPKKPKPRPAHCAEEEPCDPCIKPYSKASNTSSSPMKCPSATTLYGKVAEPSSMPKQFFPSFRSFSDKAKKVDEKCEKLTKKKSVSEEMTSRVSCAPQKDVKGGNLKTRCMTDLCRKVDTWIVCDKPPPINEYKCPVIPKRKNVGGRKPLTKPPPPCIIKPTFIECPCRPPFGYPKCPPEIVAVEEVKPKCCKIMNTLKMCPCPKPPPNLCFDSLVKPPIISAKRCVCAAPEAYKGAKSHLVCKKLKVDCVADKEREIKLKAAAIVHGSTACSSRKNKP